VDPSHYIHTHGSYNQTIRKQVVPFWFCCRCCCSLPLVEHDYGGFHIRCPAGPWYRLS